MTPTNHKPSQKLILPWAREDGELGVWTKSSTDTSDDTTTNTNSRGHSSSTFCALDAGLRAKVEFPLMLTRYSEASATSSPIFPTRSLKPRH